MERPLISCIMPVFNGERYVKEALDSILAQTYRPIECIVVDDGSKDGTAAVVAEYGKRVRYFRQPNAGETSARKLGLTVAQGEFIAFLDADDFWHTEKLALQMARFRERPGLDLCFTHFQNFWVPELAEEERRYRGHRLSEPLAAYGICTLLARRDAFERFGNFPEDGSRNPQNMIWFLHAAEHGAAIEILPDVLAYRRLHPNNLSRRNGLDSFFPILKAWRDYQRRQAGDRQP
jgi:glycosyltransferase involved in cell wall biosynthesis